MLYVVVYTSKSEAYQYLHSIFSLRTLIMKVTALHEDQEYRRFGIGH